MADFRTKLITLAGVATMFAGMAYGQATVPPNGLSASAVFIRAEGTTELLAPSTVVVNQNPAAAASLNLTVYLTPAVAITSEVVNKVSETVATPAGGTAVAGTVSGSSVAFTGIVIPAGSGQTLVTIANIRVNASTIATSTGVPTGVSETVFVGGTGVTPVVPTPVVVAYALNGLGAIAGSGQTQNTVCGGAAISLLNFTVSISDGFAGAFKTKVDETGAAMAGAANNSATSGTRFAITFANVPPNTSVYVPLSVAATKGPAALSSITSPTGAISLSTDAAVKNEPAGGVAAVTIANGTGTAYYEVTTDNLGAINTYGIGVYLVNAAGSLTGPASNITATVTLAPIGSSTNYPNFVSGTSTATVNGSTFIACSTTLLFPYLTNVSGFESGIAIANTSLDNLGSKGGSSVATQTGTCSLSFYGSSTPPAYPTASVAPGTTTAFTLTTAAGAGFTGYVLANCNFQYAHGFTYIVSQFGSNNGVAMGYVAFPLPQPRAIVNGIESLGN